MEKYFNSELETITIQKVATQKIHPCSQKKVVEEGNEDEGSIEGIWNMKIIKKTQRKHISNPKL